MSDHDVVGNGSFFLLTNGDTRTNTDALPPSALGGGSFELGGNRYEVERSVGYYSLSDPVGWAALSGYRIEEDGSRLPVFGFRETDTSSFRSFAHTTGEIDGALFFFIVAENFFNGRASLRSFLVAGDGNFSAVSSFDIERNYEGINRLSFFSVDGSEYLLISTSNQYDSGSRVQLQLLTLSANGVPEVMSGNVDARMLQQDIVTPPVVIGSEVFVIGREFDRTTFEYDLVNLISVGLDGTMSIERAIEGDAGAALLSAVSLVPLEIDGTTYIFTLGAGDEGVKAFALGAGGMLTDATRHLSLAELGLEGTTSLDARIVDGRPYLFTSDGTVEVIVADIDLVSASDTGLSGTDNVTSDTTPTIEFLAAAGAELEVNWDDGRGFIAAGTASGTRQSLTLDPAYSDDGLKSIQVRATDAENNAVTLQIDVRIGTLITTFSGLPTLVAASDSGTAGDLLTNDTTPTLSLAVDAGANILIDWDDGRGFVAAGTGTGTAQEFTLDIPYEADGQKQIQVRANLPFNDITQVDGPTLIIDTVAPLLTKLPLTATDTEVDYSDYINYRNPDYEQWSAPNLSSVSTGTVNGTKYVFADGGNLAFALNSVGELSAAPGVAQPDVLDTTSDQLVIGGETYRFTTNSLGLVVYAVADNGDETEVASLRSTDQVPLDKIVARATAQIDGSSYLIVVSSDPSRAPIQEYLPPINWSNGDIKVFSVSEDGNLRLVQAIPNSNDLPLWIARSLHVADFDGRQYAFSGSAFENGFASFRIDGQSVALVDPALGGIPDLDLMTIDDTPTISFGFEAGASVEIDWDDGAGPVSAGQATGAYQEATLAAPYVAAGARTVEVRATDAAGNMILQQLEITLVASVFGTEEGEAITGTSDGEYIAALGGDDWITPGAGSDTVDGGAGSDMVSFVNLASGVQVDLNAGRALSGSDVNELIQVENVTGTIYGDFIRGDENDNRIRALGDYDWLVGSGGADFFDGGEGRDMVSYVYSPDAVEVSLGSNRGRAGQADGDRYESIERVTGSIYSDLFYGSDGEDDFRGLGGYDWFVGSEGGRDRYDGGSGYDTVAYTLATSGVTASLLLGYGSRGQAARDLYTSIERLTGSNHDDILTGDNGRNVLRGMYGEDLLIGNGGVDYLYGGGSNDTIDGGSGWDVAMYDLGRDQYSINTTETGHIVAYNGSGREGTDVLVNIEALQFSDGFVYL